MHHGFTAGSLSTRIRGAPPMGALPVLSGAVPPIVPLKFRLDANGNEMAYVPLIGKIV